MDEYNLSTDDMSDVSRWFQTRKAAGIVPQPWELEKLIQGKYKALYNERANMRGLGVQEGRLAETKRMNDINVNQKVLDRGLQQQILSDKINQIELDRKAAREAGIWNLAGSVGTTAAMYPYLKKN
jgi:hypothetical protein